MVRPPATFTLLTLSHTPTQGGCRYRVHCLTGPPYFFWLVPEPLLLLQKYTPHTNRWQTLCNTVRVGAHQHDMTLLLTLSTQAHAHPEYYISLPHNRWGEFASITCDRSNSLILTWLDPATGDHRQHHTQPGARHSVC